MISPAFQTATATRSSLLRLIGVKCFSFDQRMESRKLMVRLFRLREIPLLMSLLQTDIFARVSGLSLGSSSQEYALMLGPLGRGESLLSFLKWIKNIFSVLYVIEKKEIDRPRVVGFIGIYGVKEESLRLALAIFNPSDRRRGYGKEALEVVIDSLRRKRVAKAAYVEVDAANEVSLNFFKNCGFEICQKVRDRWVLSKRISP